METPAKSTLLDIPGLTQEVQSSASSSSYSTALESKSTAVGAIKALSVVPQEAYVRAEKVFHELIEKRRSKIVSKSVSPAYIPAEKLLALPSSFFNMDTMLGCWLVRICSLMGIEPHKIESPIIYTEPEDEVGFISGLIIALGDVNTKINVTAASEDVELARKFVRAQQMLHYATVEKKLDPRVLKLNHLFFGNHPGEETRTTVGRVKVSTITRTHLSKLTEDFAIEDVLQRLIKHSFSLVKTELLEACLVDNLMPLSEAISYYCSRSVSTTSGTRKKPTITTKHVVSKLPTRSPVLTPAEMKLITHLCGYLFTLPDYMSTDKKWLVSLREKGYSAIEALRSHYKLRDNFLRVFSSATTTRLNQLRLRLAKSEKKKKDVSIADLSAFVSGLTDYSANICGIIWALGTRENHFREKILHVPDDTEFVGIPAEFKAKIREEMSAITGITSDSWDAEPENKISASSSSSSSSTSDITLAEMNRLVPIPDTSTKSGKRKLSGKKVVDDDILDQFKPSKGSR